MIRGPKIYRGTRPAKCYSDKKPLRVGDIYYVVTGYGSGNIATFCKEHVSLNLQLEATQKRVVRCQNPACRKEVPYEEMRTLGACPECGMAYDEQYDNMILNNLVADTKLVLKKGILTRVVNK
jgi:hypothetical protein